jgi:hypothetical protein
MSKILRSVLDTVLPRPYIRIKEHKTGKWRERKMSVYEDIYSAIKLDVAHGDPDKPSDHGREVLEFIAHHFDLRPLTPAAREAVRYAGSKDERVFRSDDPVETSKQGGE